MDSHEVFLLFPKCYANPWSDSGDRELDLEELTRGCCSSREPRPHRSDRCRPQLGFCLGYRLGVFSVVPCGYCFEFGSVRSSVGLFGVLGFSGLNLSYR
jgi:hypothetical protein